eukprot:768437-Hanusia_phi.AAC.2
MHADGTWQIKPAMQIELSHSPQQNSDVPPHVVFIRAPHPQLFVALTYLGWGRRSVKFVLCFNQPPAPGITLLLQNASASDLYNPLSPCSHNSMMSTPPACSSFIEEMYRH